MRLTIYRPTGLTYELVCPQAQFNSNTKEADAKGGVRVTSSDSMEITTAEIHFDGNHLTNHIPVQFRVDRWTATPARWTSTSPARSLRLYEKRRRDDDARGSDEVPMNLKAAERILPAQGELRRVHAATCR